MDSSSRSESETDEPPPNSFQSSTAMFKGIGSIAMSDTKNMQTAQVIYITNANGHSDGGNPKNEDEPVATRADHEIYSNQLLTKKRGYPLWVPGPAKQLPIQYRRKGMTIGDVGIITSLGAFNFLFNIFQPATHPINRGGVPQGFSPLVLEDFMYDIQEDTVYGPDTHLASSSVQMISMNRISDTSSVRQFQSSAKEVAILVMPHGAATQDLFNIQRICDIISESNNAVEWYKYAKNTRGRDVKNGDIRVVVGIDKVSSWGIATSACRVGQTTSYVFKHDPPHADIWECAGGCGRVGPQKTETCDLIQDNTIPQNQSVFVRTINFTFSGEVWKNFPSGAVVEVGSGSGSFDSLDFASSNRRGPGQGSGSSGSSASPSHQSHSTQASLSYTSSVNLDLVEMGVHHPSAALHNCLHEKFPDARMVITEDRDWISVLDDADMVFPEPEDLSTRILKVHELQNNSGIIRVLRRDDTESRPRRRTTQNLPATQRTTQSIMSRSQSRNPSLPPTEKPGWLEKEKASEAAVAKVGQEKPMAGLKTYTMAQVEKHTAESDCWIVVHGLVYDCTRFLKDHSGGVQSIMINAGTDCSEDFDAIHSEKAQNMLSDYLIGELPGGFSTADDTTRVEDSSMDNWSTGSDIDSPHSLVTALEEESPFLDQKQWKKLTVVRHPTLRAVTASAPSLGSFTPQQVAPRNRPGSMQSLAAPRRVSSIRPTSMSTNTLTLIKGLTRSTNTPPIAEAGPGAASPVGERNRGGQSFTTFRNVHAGDVSKGVFVNTSGLVTNYYHAENVPSRQPLLIQGTAANIISTQDHNSTMAEHSEYEIYYKYLSVKQRGTPLWEPGPQMMLPTEYRANGVSIGDVGIFNPTAGCFTFLFNIFLPANHNINEGRVPSGFTPLDMSRVQKSITKRMLYHRGGCLASSSLRRTESSNFSFQTTGREGAVLVMPDGALAEDLGNYKLVEKYIAANAKSWWEYVESEDCGVQNENVLQVVVGTDKVSSWGMATFENVEGPREFELRDDGTSQGRTYEWKNIFGTVGPSEKEIQDLLPLTNAPVCNQCVFIRAINVSKVQELAVHSSSPGQRTVKIQTSKRGLLNEYLTEKPPNTDIVITRDSVLDITENDATMPSDEDI